MRSVYVILATGLLTTFWLNGHESSAQQITTASPAQRVSDSFFERSNVAWAGNWNGMEFRFGGSGLGVPPFGGFQPNAGLGTAFGMSGRHGQANFAMDFGQGSQRSSVSQTPMLTTMNGMPGYFCDTSQTPFVVGVIPVVGGYSTMNWSSPLLSPEQLAAASGTPLPTGNPRVQAMLAQGPATNAARRHATPPDLADEPAASPVHRHMLRVQDSSAARPAPSVAEARRIHEAATATADEEMQTLFAQAQAAESDGKPAVAKVYYQIVAHRATGPLQHQAASRLSAIRSASPKTR